MSSNISIAMATYNGQAFLGEQLESLAAQQLLPLELVVTDDGSVDATPEMVADFAKRAPFPVRFHSNPSRLGFAENFLRATSLCEGEFVAFSDQDDVWLPQKLACVAAEFCSSDCDVVIHAAAVVNEALIPNGHRHPPVRQRIVVGPGGFDPWLMVPGMAMVAKRELFTVVDPSRRPNARLAEGRESMIHDEWLYFIGTALGKVVLLPDALVKYRQHGSNATGPPSTLSSNVTLRLARTAGQSVYEKMGRRAQSYSDFLRALPLTQEPYAGRLEASIAFYDRVADQLRLRSSLYRRDARLPLRTSILAKLIASGAYRTDKAGALTLRSLAKDTLRAFGVLRVS
jgi:glycosyltransferase involved in cell wall biosynthesis